MSKRNLEDLKFVLSEINRHQREFTEGTRLDRRNAFCTIPHLTGHGSVLVGRAGYDALDRLCRRDRFHPHEKAIGFAGGTPQIPVDGLSCQPIVSKDAYER